MDYLKLLEHSFEMERADTGRGCPPETRLAYLSESIFDFTTYDGEKDEFFGRKAVEVCTAINDGKTFDFIRDADNYTWFLVMCNMPFFAERLEWGTSIRGAWWAGRPGKQIEFDSCGLWMGDEQLIDTLKFSADEWKRFIAAVIEFAHGEMKQERRGKYAGWMPTMQEIADLHRKIDATEKAKAEFLSVLQKYWSGTINELVEAVEKQNELIGDFLAADSHDAMNLIYLRAETIHGEIAIKVGSGETANAKLTGLAPGKDDQ